MSLDNTLNIIMPWLVGILIIGFVLWVMREPLKYLIRLGKNLFEYGQEKFEGGEFIEREIVYK